MRVLVCGGRGFRPEPADYTALATFIVPGVTLIHGDARGADRWAARFADEIGVDVLSFPADWAAHGRAAGAIRNRRMLDEGKPDLVLAFPGGRGTADMVAKARAAGVRVVFARIYARDWAGEAGL